MTGSLPFSSVHVSRQLGNDALKPYGVVDTRSSRRPEASSPAIRASFHADTALEALDESSKCRPMSRVLGTVAPAGPEVGATRRAAMAAPAAVAAARSRRDMAERTGRAPSAWTNRASPLNEQQLPQLVLARSVCGEVRFLSSALRVGSEVADAATIAPDPPRQHGHRAAQIEESDLPRDIAAFFAGRTHIRTGFGERRSRQWAETL